MAKKLQFVGKFSTDDSIPAPSTASVGQTIVVKAVDENGKPTEWETKDFPEEICRPNASWLQYDGDPTGKVTIEYEGYTFVKISDTTVRPDTISNIGALLKDEEDMARVIDIDAIDGEILRTNSIGRLKNMPVIICASDGSTIGSSGVYFNAVIDAYDEDLLYVNGCQYINNIVKTQHLPIDRKTVDKTIEELASSGKIGNETMEKIVLLPLTAATPIDEDRTQFSLPHVKLVEGETYMVTLNGETYKTVGYLFDDMVSIGEQGHVNGNVTGEPFVAIDAGEMLYILTLSPNESITLEIYQETVTDITPIKPEYLPGVCLPMVEITSAEYSLSGKVALSAEESAQLQAAYDMELPIACKFTGSSFGRVHEILGWSEYVFSTTLHNDPDIAIYIFPLDGVWYMGVPE